MTCYRAASRIRTPGWLARRFIAASVTVRSIRRSLVSAFLVRTELARIGTELTHQYSGENGHSAR
ncbi:hypothetical protein SAMN04490239_2164 [Rhodococcus koreensis]|uniref:Uncharacterized protein n=1 Tax=Rhodococcus koreensis TaxID=99653 RepID=A0A1H4N7L3_9NOCA|nr:hypothetical protein SAMN04490239_2164 [Rhodococcus koreensis]